MKQTFFLSLLIFMLGVIQSCSSTQHLEQKEQPDSQVVATIEDRPITLEELKRGYTGSLVNESVSTIELRNFLPSFVDYRLKVLEGRQLGYFDDPDIQSEYKTYAKESAKKLWMNSEVKSRILDTFIQRSQKELLAYHILITAQNPDYQESKEIKRQLEKARNELLEGTVPDSVNIKYSTSQNGNYAGGPLPWITAGRTVKSFEDALYSLEPGEVSRPFQTQFGFHIVYFIDERSKTPERFTRHIFVSKQSEENPDQKISEALDSLKHGVDWNTVVSEFSEDRRTASIGGEIGWVGYGMQFPEPFVDEVMTVTSENEFSEVIEMDYGFHIIRVDSVRNLKSRDALEEYANSELERLGRLQPGDEELYDMLKKYGNFRFFKDEFVQVAEYLSGEADTFNPDTQIAEFNERTVTADQFADYYEQEVGDESISVDNAFEQFTNRLIESNLIELTKERFDTYRFEMEQFLNGLVVFKVNEEFLWNPDAADKQMLTNHFEQNREKYKTNRTISYTRITSTSDSVIASARVDLLENKYPENLEETHDDIIIRSGRVSNRNSELFELLNTFDENEVSKIENNETWHQFYYITSIEPQRPMNFQEAKSEVFNEVRDRHESDYLESLRDKYQIEMYPENVQ